MSSLGHGQQLHSCSCFFEEWKEKLFTAVGIVKCFESMVTNVLTFLFFSSFAWLAGSIGEDNVFEIH